MHTVKYISYIHEVTFPLGRKLQNHKRKQNLCMSPPQGLLSHLNDYFIFQVFEPRPIK